MGKVVLDMAISLDGFVAGPNDEDGGLHDYFFSPSPETAAVIAEGIQETGAIIMGRRTYNLGDQYDGFADTPYKVPHLVLSHSTPAKPTKGETKFIFVPDGIELALAQAQGAAGAGDVVIGGGANIAQQFLAAGLIDQIQLHLVPKLLGQGLRLFDTQYPPKNLERTHIVAAPDVTHITYRVLR
jgi:dihydrofolate reductase